MESPLTFPKFYAIADRATLDAHGLGVGAFARELRRAGVTLVQYRDKTNGPQEVLRAAGEIAEAFAGVDATLILNDRADLAALLGWGCHVGQGDLAVEAARQVLASTLNAVVGISTHNEEQVRVASDLADYVAIGPVFSTRSKLNPDPVIGLEGVRRARALTRKPLVAIGGITMANAQSVIDAGADSVAVISGLFVPGRAVQDVAAEFLRLL